MYLYEARASFADDNIDTCGDTTKSSVLRMIRERYRLKKQTSDMQGEYR